MPHSCESDGIVAFLRFQQHLNRPPPYLRRNIRHSLQCLTMGSYPSGLSGSKNVAREPQADENLGGSIDDDRPSKRRRISSDGSNIKTKRPSTVTPSRFYGSSGLGLAKPPIDSIVQRVAANDPPEFRKALRIDILGIIPKGEEPEFVLEQHTIDIKCSVSIFWATTEKTQDGVIRKDDYEEVCRSAMLGKLEVQAEENGEITRRIILPRPFIFSSEEFFVGRNKDFSRRPDTDGKKILLRPNLWFYASEKKTP